MLGLRHQPAKEAPLAPLSTPELTKLSQTLACVLSTDEVNQIDDLVAALLGVGLLRALRRSLL